MAIVAGPPCPRRCLNVTSQIERGRVHRAACVRSPPCPGLGQAWVRAVAVSGHVGAGLQSCSDTHGVNEDVYCALCWGYRSSGTCWYESVGEFDKHQSAYWHGNNCTGV